MLKFNSELLLGQFTADIRMIGFIETLFIP